VHVADPPQPSCDQRISNSKRAGTPALPNSTRERIEFAVLAAIITAFTTGPVYVVAVRAFSATGTWEDAWIKYTFIVASALGCGAWISAALDHRLRKPGLAFLLAGL
jgi:hypothetical protein